MTRTGSGLPEGAGEPVPGVPKESSSGWVEEHPEQIGAGYTAGPQGAPIYACK